MKLCLKLRFFISWHFFANKIVVVFKAYAVCYNVSNLCVLYNICVIKCTDYFIISIQNYKRKIATMLSFKFSSTLNRTVHLTCDLGASGNSKISVFKQQEDTRRRTTERYK